MSSSPPLTSQVEPESTHGAVAPAWHTAVVLLVLLGLSLAGALTAERALSHARIFTYLVTMTIEWLTVLFIWYGLHLRGVGMKDVIRGSWPRFKDVLRDLGIAIGFLLVSGALLNGIGRLLKTSTPEAIRKGLPQSPAEIAVWLLLALTAGFCEELIFRGYLQRQFTALTRSLAGGIVLQGMVFGAAHGYQGWKLMLTIAVFGSMFGMLAHWRRSLRPGMLAHFLQDGIGGILARHLAH